MLHADGFSCHYSCVFFLKGPKTTLPETTIAPVNRPSQNETSLPTIHFQGLCLFQEHSDFKQPFTTVIMSSYVSLAGQMRVSAIMNGSKATKPILWYESQEYPLTFHFTGCLIGIFIVVCCNPNINGQYFCPLKNFLAANLTWTKPTPNKHSSRRMHGTFVYLSRVFAYTNQPFHVAGPQNAIVFRIPWSHSQKVIGIY